jgi:transcriptional regulator with XRE-family HTH domain
MKCIGRRWHLTTPPAAVTTTTPQAQDLEMKERTLDGFGVRLSDLRQARGLSQEELAAAVDVSRRVIAYYEAQSAQPPGALLVDLARALKVSTDELLGVKPITEKLSPKTARLLKRLQRIEELPPADQRAVLKLVDAMLDTRRRSTPPPRTKRKAS